MLVWLDDDLGNGFLKIQAGAVGQERSIKSILSAGFGVLL